MLVPELYENRNSLLPDEFYECLPQYCEDCGYPMEISEALTQLHCGNPKCISKSVKRLVAIANALGVKDLGDSKAEKFLRHWGITNPLFIFGFEPDVDGPLADGISLEVSKKIVSQFEEKKSFTLPEYIKIANLPYIQMSAFSVFEDFDDINEAYKVIESRGVEYIRDKLSIKEKDTEDISVRALKIYESLMTFKDDLIECIGYVKIIPTHVEGLTKIKAVCSTKVGVGFRTKADFYATCNNLYNDIHIEFGNSVTKTTDYLVWAGADGSPCEVTNKVRKARDYQAHGSSIQIVTAMQFISILESLTKNKVEA